MESPNEFVHLKPGERIVSEPIDLDQNKTSIFAFEMVIRFHSGYDPNVRTPGFNGDVGLPILALHEDGKWLVLGTEHHKDTGSGYPEHLNQIFIGNPLLYLAQHSDVSPLNTITPFNSSLEFIDTGKWLHICFELKSSDHNFVGFLTVDGKVVGEVEQQGNDAAVHLTHPILDLAFNVPVDIYRISMINTNIGITGAKSLMKLGPLSSPSKLPELCFMAIADNGTLANPFGDLPDVSLPDHPVKTSDTTNTHESETSTLSGTVSTASSSTEESKPPTLATPPIPAPNNTGPLVANLPDLYKNRRPMVAFEQSESAVLKYDMPEPNIIRGYHIMELDISDILANPVEIEPITRDQPYEGISKLQLN